MTLPLPSTVKDSATQECLDQIARQYPVSKANIANEAVGTKQLGKAQVTDEKLAKPVIVGTVSGAGAVVNGSGFTSEKAGMGTYKITLSTELPSVGVLVATAAEFNRVMRCPTTASKKVFEVFSVSLGEVAADTSFQFHIKAS